MGHPYCRNTLMIPCHTAAAYSIFPSIAARDMFYLPSPFPTDTQSKPMPKLQWLSASAGNLSILSLATDLLGGSFAFRPFGRGLHMPRGRGFSLHSAGCIGLVNWRVLVFWFGSLLGKVSKINSKSCNHLIYILPTKWRSSCMLR